VTASEDNGVKYIVRYSVKMEVFASQEKMTYHTRRTHLLASVWVTGVGIIVMFHTRIAKESNATTGVLVAPMAAIACLDTEVPHV
jgi:hypothetical protein